MSIQKKLFIIDAHKAYTMAKGTLVSSLADLTASMAEEKGWSVKRTNIDSGYKAAEEVQKMLEADVIVFVWPVWWYALPWPAKKYLDEVLTEEGYGKLWTSADKYEEHAKIGENKHVLSVSTWGASEDMFDDPRQFYGPGGSWVVSRPVTWPFEFCGSKVIKPFVLGDALGKRAGSIPKQIEQYKAHCEQHLFSLA